MASSSDWIAELAAPVKEETGATPSWIAALGDSQGFREGVAFRTRGDAWEQDQSASEDTLPGSTDEEADALKQAFADGEAAGRAAATEEFEDTTARQRDVRLAFRSLDQAAMDAFAESLSQTVLSLCGQVLDASAINAEGLAQRVQAAAKLLGAATDQCTLHLNPLDIEMLGTSAPEGWELKATEDLPRGSLRLESGDGLIHDGPNEWRRAIAEALRG